MKKNLQEIFSKPNYQFFYAPVPEVTESEFQNLFDRLWQELENGNLGIQADESTKKIAKEYPNLFCLEKDWIFFQKVYDEILKFRKILNSWKPILETKKEIKSPISFDFLSLDATQASAIESLLGNRIQLVTGGPGTGKTTLVAIFLYFLFEEKSTKPEDIFLLAPTGRASVRMKESIQFFSNLIQNPEFDAWVSGISSSTIHRALDFNSFRNEYTFSSKQYLPKEVFIIDEVSMLDMELANHLFQAISFSKEKTRLVLLGDENQLSSVSFGEILKDLKTFLTPFSAVSELKNSHRQTDAGKSIVLNSQKWMSSSSFESLEWNANTEQFGFQSRISQDTKQFERIYQEVLGTFETKQIGFLRQFYANKSNESIPRILYFSKILTSNRIGPYGSESINSRLHKKILYEIAKLQGKLIHRDFYYEGLPILILQNDSNRNIFNGDLGIILQKEGIFYAGFFQKNEIEFFPIDSLPSHALGYAITIHKSQGSEFDDVIAIFSPSLENAPKLITKNLVYTAITRAKTSVQVIGVQKDLESAIQQTKSRFSLFGEE